MAPGGENGRSDVDHNVRGGVLVDVRVGGGHLDDEQVEQNETAEEVEQHDAVDGYTGSN